MSKHGHMPPVPPANRSHEGTGDNSETANEMPKLHADVNTQEQGDTANIRQNTPNKGFFKDRQIK